MNKYVTKAKVIKAIEKAVAPEIITIGDYETIGVFTRESIKQIVSNLPAADVAEVRHGRLNFLQEDMVWCYCGVCSVCGNYVQAWNYCPNCGTRMDKENKHKVRCAKCGKIKEMVCTVDGKPWCEDCFDKAMGSGTKHETN